MPTEYAEDKGLSEAVTGLLADQSLHPLALLRDHEVKIECCLCIRTNKEGDIVAGKGDPVKVKKVSPVEQVFLDCDYILVVDNHAWTTSNSEVKSQAMLFDALMRIDVQPADEGGCKKKTRKPTVSAFRETIAYFGAYTDDLIDLRDAFGHGAKRVAEALRPQPEPEDEAPPQEESVPRRRNRAPVKD